MQPSLQDIGKQISALSDNDKLTLVDQLLHELDVPDPGIENAWSEECARRLEAVREGRLSTRPLDDVMAKYSYE